MKLIYHEYSNDEVLQKCSPTKLSIENGQVVELPELQSEVAECIKNSNIAVAYRHNESHKDFGYVCFSIQSGEENKLYEITDIILDDNLEEAPIRLFIKNSIELLLNSFDDPTHKDYIKVNGQYPLCEWEKANTIEKVCNEVVSQWKVYKEGIKSNPNFMEQLYDERGKLNNTK